jgi:hypothetical protein
LYAHLDDPLGLRHCERLSVGIGDNEIDPLQPCANHIVDRISACTAHPKHGNPRLQLPQIGALLVDAHAFLFDAGASPTTLTVAGPPPAALVDLTGSASLGDRITPLLARRRWVPNELLETLDLGSTRSVYSRKTVNNQHDRGG